MGKVRKKEIDSIVEREEKGVTDNEVRGLTVGMTAYKPVPNFRGHCANC